MAINDIEKLYEFSLMQLAAESYLDDGFGIGDRERLKKVLTRGTNREGYNNSVISSLGESTLNQGWPGFTRMADPQFEEFYSKFEIVHQWSDNPSTGPTPGSRPAEDLDHLMGVILNSQDCLANTGFSGTLIRTRGTDQYTLSFRSTESRPWEFGGDKERDMFATDACGVAGMGFALAQLDAMEKYYQWLKDNAFLPRGATLNVTGYSLGGHLATVFTEMHQNDPDIVFGNTVTFNGAGRGNWNTSAGSEADFLAYYREVLNDPGYARINLADCSVGELVRAAAWITASGFSGFSLVPLDQALFSLSALSDLQERAVAVAGTPFDDKSIYQDCRYGWAAIATMLKFDLSPQLPIGEGLTLADDKITQVYGYEAIHNANMTANSQNNAGEQPVAIESQPLVSGMAGFPVGDFGFGHSIDLVTDSLALQRAVNRLDPSFDLGRMLVMMPMLSRRDTRNVIGVTYEADPLENILDSLRKVVFGPAVTATPFVDGAGGFGDWQSRNTFHQNIQSLMDSTVYQAISGKVRFALADPLQAMSARDDFSSFLGLLTLSPVYLQATAGNGEFLNQQLSAAWPDVYTGWSADRAAPQAIHYSDGWIQDRAAMLHWLLQLNLENSSDLATRNPLAIEGILFSDLGTGQQVTALSGLDDQVRSHVLFDSDNPVAPLAGGEFNDRLYAGTGGSELHGENGSDRLEGSASVDNLFGDSGRDTLLGMDGDDILDGGRDADRLEGGVGDDKYVIHVGDGVDTIFDVDGRGSIVIDGTPLAAGVRQSSSSWLSFDGRFRYVLGVAVDGRPNLQVYPLGGNGADNVTMLFIEHFTSGDLGIELPGAPDADPATLTLIAGDVAPAQVTSIDANGEPYLAMTYDALGNVVGSAGADPRPDMLLGSAGADQILGGEGNDTLLGRAGNDQLQGDSGADFLAGGLGSDQLEGGDGNDILFGDSDPWWAVTQAGLQPVPDGVAAPVAGALFVDSGIGWARFQIDAGSIVVSNANPDTVSPVLLQLDPVRFGQASLLWYPSHSFGQSAGGIDTLVGGQGDDTEFGEAGNDLLAGGDGSDALHGGSGNDVLEGDDGDDVLFGDDLTFAAFRWSELDYGGYYHLTPQLETYESEFGSDLLRGGAGNDYLFGMAGADVLYGEAGNDYLVGDFFEVVSVPLLRLDDEGTQFVMDDSTHFQEAVSFHGNDYLDGGDGDDYLVGLAGDDQLFGGNGADVLIADGNPDEVQGRYGNDFLDGGPGRDFLQGSGGDDHLVGGDGNDELWGDEYAGTDGQTVASWGSALMGADTTPAMLAQDLHGSDYLEGGDGEDTLTGGGRDDRLEGGAGNDLLYGDGIGVLIEGNDWLFGGDGDDELQGNGGDDILMGEAGNDRLFGQVGDDLMSGGEGDDAMDGGSGADALAGDAGADILFGGEGDDVLDGGTDDDKLMGGAGNDTLTGGYGIDYLNGGDGDDVYCYALGDASMGLATIEEVMDTAGSNHLQLDNASVDSIRLRNVQGSNDLILEYGSDDGIYIHEGRTRAIATYRIGGQEVAWDELVANHLLDPVLQREPSDNIYAVGGRSDDTLALGSDASVRGGLGNDQILLQGLRDTVVFNRGDGVDTVTATCPTADPSRASHVRLGADISPDDLTLVLRRSTTWGPVGILDIQIGADGLDVLRVDVSLDNLLGNPVLGWFDFSRGQSLSFADLVFARGITVLGTDQADSLWGSNLGDRLLGGAGDDVLTGGAGADWLQGDAGNDYLAGGPGGDTYVYRLAEGDDRILDQDADAAALDTVCLGEGITPDNIQFGRDDHDLTMRVRNSPGSLVIVGEIDMPDQRVERFEFADGSVWSVEDVIARALPGPLPIYLVGTDAGDHLDGGEGDDQLIGLGGNDLLVGAGGNDSLSGGEGVDQLWGDAGNDVLTGAGGADSLYGGAGMDVLQGGADDDRLDGNDDDDTLWGDDGNDSLAGGAGDDRLDGGAGSDVLAGGTGRDTLLGQSGDDLLSGNADDDSLWGGDGDDLLAGDDGCDELHGGTGTDVLGGDAGDDVLYGDAGEDGLYGGDGQDVLDGGIGRDRLFGDAGDDVLLGGEDSDFLRGDDGNDTLWGGDGDDYELSGGAGNDMLHGGDGADLLLGDDGNDHLFGDGGDDLLWGGAGDDDMHGGDGNDELTGGSGSDAMYGDAGDDRLAIELLDSDAGPDTLAGGAGNDTYVLQFAVTGNPFKIVEYAGEGNDTVISFGNYTLPDNVENLTLEGFSGMLNFNGAGNSLANVLRGNAGSNALTGGAGDDTYYVGAGDSVTEQALGGTDTVISDIDWTLGANIENLTLAGPAQRGTGNVLANRLLGNIQDNVLDGGSGADFMEGGAGNDLYIVDSAVDQVIERQQEGIDTVQSSVSIDALMANVENLTLVGKLAINGAGNSLPNLIAGNGAANILKGGAGDDIYVVGSKDTVIEAADEGIDTVRSAITWQLSANIENLELTGSGKISGSGNDLDNRMVGNSAANLLKGGRGNDTYVVGTGDSITENAGEGIDSVEASVSWSLGANIENLTLTGGATIDGSGNSLANRLRGNSASNVLRGGAGDDCYLFGRGGGADTLVDADVTLGNSDSLLFDDGISREQLWFRHVANSLEVSIIGSADRVTISDWYSGGSNHVERLQLADGEVLSHTQVEVLVQAMAAMQPPPAGQTELSVTQVQELEPVLAASWQAA